MTNREKHIFPIDAELNISFHLLTVREKHIFPNEAEPNISFHFAGRNRDSGTRIHFVSAKWMRYN
jgi:hypothetical protein